MKSVLFSFVLTFLSQGAFAAESVYSYQCQTININTKIAFKLHVNSNSTVVISNGNENNKLQVYSNTPSLAPAYQRSQVQVYGKSSILNFGKEVNQKINANIARGMITGEEKGFVEWAPSYSRDSRAKYLADCKRIR